VDKYWTFVNSAVSTTSNVSCGNIVANDITANGNINWTPNKNITCTFTGNNQECSIDLMNQNTYTGNHFQVWSDKIGTMLCVRGDNGGIGIGTTSPSQKLDVRGKGYFEVNTNTGLHIYNNDGSANDNSAELVLQRDSYADVQKAAVGMDRSSRDFFIWVNGSDRMNISTEGNVGIGYLASTSYKLDVNGKLRTAGAIHIDDGYNGIHFHSTANPIYQWQINHDVAGEGDNIGNLNFYADSEGIYNNRQHIAYIEDDVGAGGMQLNFTGSHRVVEEGKKINPKKDWGLIVVASGKYNSLLPEVKKKQIENITINEALPTIKISSKAKDKAVFGVVSTEDYVTKDGTRRVFNQGNFKSCIRKDKDNHRIIVNSLGEGGVWVCDTNGNFENGDFITTSSVSGYGERQSENYVCNYTVGKITCDVDWSDPNLDKEFQVRVVDGHTCVFVGCIYMCG
jgi:hypothetical protein